MRPAPKTAWKYGFSVELCSAVAIRDDRYVFPGAVEICEDNKINDCGSINNDRNYHVCKCRIGQATYDPPIWYRDADGDGQGSATVYVRGCARPSGYVENNTDCDDSSSSAGVTPCYVEIANAEE